jgi:hypothetical protein
VVPDRGSCSVDRDRLLLGQGDAGEPDRGLSRGSPSQGSTGDGYSAAARVMPIFGASSPPA